ncbi:phage tail sheath family protein [Cohnella nanjingensis]|uniref:Phage tail sheath family protein n=1 Tax=Cohnella nanjingensis TaxID=1387779 RepID=A0A7X0RT34_9BACL|nr:phage tail sheath family protein [Cohnella nanjingensis]MBB6673018.1 phage tail sheath family protein [Cohnella nanjingensis]
MAGGTWSPTDMPILPGFFLNFKAAALAAIGPGARGVVVVPVKAHWGPVKSFVEIVSEVDIANRFTDDESSGATAYTTLRLALLGGAKKVLAYRIADSSAAKAFKVLQDTTATPVDALRIEALHPGARANAFRLVVQPNLVDSTKKDIKLYEDTTLLRTFTFASGTVQAAVDAINGDAANQWITAIKLADGNGTLANQAGAILSAGASGISGIVNADYTAALSAFETQQFNVLALDGISDPALQASVVAWVARVRNEGKLIQAVLGGSEADDKASDAVSKATARSASFNHEGIINVGTGGVLAGVSYSSAQTSAYVAGLAAGTPLSSSTTYAPSPFSDITRRWSRSEQEQATKGGVFLHIHDGRQVKVLKGINSLVTLRAGQNTSFKKIRAISVMDAINTDLLQAAEDNYLGKVNNTAEGRLALISAMKAYMLTLAQGGVIEATGYDVMLDPAYHSTAPTGAALPDQVFLKWTARLTDVMEQILGTFIVQ